MGGRAGGGAGRSGGGGFGGATERGLSVQEARTLLAEEAGIRGNNFETAVIVDANGKIVMKKAGQKTSVSFDGANLTNNTLTHNHPAAYKDHLGRPIANASFSHKDIITAISTNSKGMRVISQGGYHFSMTRPAGGWGVGGKAAAYTVGAERRRLNAWVKSYINGYKGDKRVAAARAEQVYWHKLSKSVSKTLGYTYTKQKIK